MKASSDVNVLKGELDPAGRVARHGGEEPGAGELRRVQEGVVQRVRDDPGTVDQDGLGTARLKT